MLTKTTHTDRFGRLEVRTSSRPRKSKSKPALVPLRSEDAERLLIQMSEDYRARRQWWEKQLQNAPEELKTKTALCDRRLEEIQQLRLYIRHLENGT